MEIEFVIHYWIVRSGRFIKRVIHASYEHDRKLFKWRNRILLLLFIFFMYFIFSGDEEVNTEKTNKNTLKKKTEIILRIEDINCVSKDDNSSDPDIDKICGEKFFDKKDIPVEETALSTEEDDIVPTGPYHIVIMTLRNSERANKYVEKHRDFVVFEKPGNKFLIVTLAGFESFEEAKKFKSEKASVFPKDSYIAKIGRLD